MNTKGLYLLGRVTSTGTIGKNGSMPVRIYPMDTADQEAHTTATKNVSLSREDLDTQDIAEITLWTAPNGMPDKKGALKAGDIICGHFDVVKLVNAKANDPADATGKAKVDRVKLLHGEPVVDQATGECTVLKSMTIAPSGAKDVVILRSRTLEESVKVVTSIPGLSIAE